jgi:uncharacterized coiled-coil protein SlyX
MADETMDFERRLVEIESKASFQESELIDMSEIIRSQDARIGRLEATLRALIEKVKEMAGEGQSPLPANERPPHY